MSNRLGNERAGFRVAAVLLVVATLAITLGFPPGGSARAEAAPCAITGLSTHRIIVGTRQQTAQLRVKSNCRLRAWILYTPDLTAASRSSKLIIDPRHLTAASTATAGVQVMALTEHGVLLQRVMPDGLRILPRSTWRQVRVTLTHHHFSIQARLVIADWKSGRYLSAGSRRVRLQFAPRGMKFHIMRTASLRDGLLRLSVPQRQSGYWRIVADQTPSAAATVYTSGFVAIR